MSKIEDREQLTDYLPRLIQTTYRARCEAERRYLQNDTLTSHANVYCACLTAILSLLSLFTDNPLIPFLSLASAIVLALAIVYATTRDYKTKAFQTRLCYNELQNLWFHVDSLLDNRPEDLNEKMLEAADSYSEILKRYDNHLPKDHRRAQQNKENAVNKKDFEYYGIRIAVYSGPIILLIVLGFAFCAIRTLL